MTALTRLFWRLVPHKHEFRKLTAKEYGPEMIPADKYKICRKCGLIRAVAKRRAKQ